MNKIFSIITISFLLGSAIFLVGRSFRVSKVPHGSKYSCNTCHTSGGGSPLNSFGLDVGARVTQNGNESFWDAELASLDSDGDGFTNGEELQDPNGEWHEGNANPGDANFITNPGNADSVPTSILDNSTIYTFELSQNYPNPFNPSTVISFQLPKKGFTSLSVYDILGREVAVLVNEERVAGKYSVEFDASNLTSGVYFSRLNSGEYSSIKKMLLVR